MRRFTLLCVLASSLLTSAAFAAPYGTAGCGLGSIIFGSSEGIFGSSEGIVQIFAATTNNLTATQTFGISSGTSNCVNTDGGHASAKVFIEANREALAKDMSRGSGETVTSLSALAGCADATAVATTLQKNFKTILPSANVSTDNLSTAILSTLKAEKSLSCKKLG